MKKLLCIILCLVMVMPCMVSCSRPPELAEIKGRLGELIEESYGINVWLFGTGPETYERLYDPRETMQYYQDGESGQRYYYYYIEDAELGKIMAYREKAYGDDYTYLLISEKEDTSENCVYVDEEQGLYYVKIDYTPKEAEFYYTRDLPSDYDVIRMDSEYISIDQVKAAAEKVYSSGYLASIYETLFTGAMISEDTSTGLLTARYMDYTDESGNVWFMMSNTYEPLSTEKRIFDLDTAEIVRRGSNAKRVRIEIETYLESKPDERLSVTLSLALEDGKWYLDSGTY